MLQCKVLSENPTTNPVGPQTDHFPPLSSRSTTNCGNQRRPAVTRERNTRPWPLLPLSSPFPPTTAVGGDALCLSWLRLPRLAARGCGSTTSIAAAPPSESPPLSPPVIAASTTGEPVLSVSARGRLAPPEGEEEAPLSQWRPEPRLLVHARGLLNAVRVVDVLVEKS